MKKVLKIAVILVVVLLLMVGAGVLLVLSNINSIAKKGIEAGGSYALGVPTTVQSVSLHPLAGQMSLSGLNVANPSGFSAGHFLSLGSGDVAVTLSSLQSDVIQVPTFKLDTIDVNLERKEGSSNYKVILDNLAKLQSGPKSAPASTPGGGSHKKLVIKDLELTKISVHVDMLGAGGGVGKVLNSAAKIDLPIEKIQLTNVGQTGTGVQGTGVTVEQLTGLIVQAVLTAAAERGGGLIPADILGDLKGGLGNLGALPMNVVGKAGDVASQLGGAVGDTVGKVGDVGKGVGDALGGLLGGKKGDKKDQPKK